MPLHTGLRCDWEATSSNNQTGRSDAVFGSTPHVGDFLAGDTYFIDSKKSVPHEQPTWQDVRDRMASR